MDNTKSFDLIVIGAGVAGLSAAQEALRAGATVALVERQIFGGLVINVNELDGEITGSGAEFASNLMNEAMEDGAATIDGEVSAIQRSAGGFLVNTTAGDYTAKALVAACGATRRKLGVPGEEEFEYRGVSHCADCDGPMFQGQDVVVVGGGDGALQSALSLANHCNRVHLVHRGNGFRGKDRLVRKVLATANIQVHFNSEVGSLTGGDRLEAAQVGGMTVPCTGFFAYVGLDPATGFLPQDVQRDARGAAVTSDALESTMPGVFVVGAARAGYGGTLAEAVAEGARAARNAVARARCAHPA